MGEEVVIAVDGKCEIIVAIACCLLRLYKPLPRRSDSGAQGLRNVLSPTWLTLATLKGLMFPTNAARECNSASLDRKIRTSPLNEILLLNGRSRLWDTFYDLTVAMS